MRLLRYVYASNPFYLVSALLVICGAGRLFPPSEDSSYDGLLMGILVGYSSLLAATAILIIRVGNVWDDARSILLVLTFLLIALSVSFDKEVIARPLAGTSLILGGLIFSLGLSVVVLRGLRIRLARRFALPFHVQLAGFFLYPLFLTGLLHLAPGASTDAGVLIFPVFFGLCILTLLPAARAGAEAARDNGTPWRWPWFPWSLFAALAICACGRTYYFALSFGSGAGMRSGFAIYLLAPIVLACCVVLFDAGRAAGNRWGQWVAVGVPLVLPLLGLLQPASAAGRMSYPELPALGSAQLELLGSLTAIAPSPAYCTLVGLAAFYVYARWRGLYLAEAGLIVTVFALSVVQPSTVDLATFSSPRLGAVVTVVLLQVFFAILRPGSLRWFMAALTAILALALAAPAFRTSWHGAAPVHLVLAAAFAIGLAYRDLFARVIRELSAAVLMVIAVAVLYVTPWSEQGSIPRWLLAAYLLGVPTFLVAYWRLTGAPIFLRAGLSTGLLYAPRVAWELSHWSLRQRWTLGVWMVLGGMLVFAVAAVISLSKAGVVRLVPRGPATAGLGGPVVKDPGNETSPCTASGSTPFLESPGVAPGEGSADSCRPVP
jgi:hypothetical protein